MAKLGILFCAFLFASGAHAAIWSDGLIAAQAAVNSVIDAAIAKMQTTIEYADLRAQSFDMKLNVTAAELEQKMYAQIREYMSQIDARLVQIYGKADGIDIKDCEEIAESLENVTLSSIAVMNACVDDKVKLGAEYVSAITSISESSIAKLTAYREEASKCSEKVEGFQSAAQAIVCTKIVGAKASMVAARSVPALVQDVTKLVYLASTLHLTVPACVAKKGFRSLVWESNVVLKRVKTCVNQKIIENKKNVTHEPAAPESTSEHSEAVTPVPATPESTSEHPEAVTPEPAAPESTSEHSEAVTPEPASPESTSEHSEAVTPEPAAPESPPKHPEAVTPELEDPTLPDPTPEQQEVIPDILEPVPDVLESPDHPTPAPEFPEFDPDISESHPHKVEDLFPEDSKPTEEPEHHE